MKKLISLLLAALLALSLTVACAEGKTITDMFGREVELPEAVTRIIALEPSDCEMLCALGCEDALVGRGKYCDYPASVLELPAVQSGKNTNLEEILALQPQVVVMSDMAHTEEQINLLEQNGVKVIGTDANSIEEVYANANFRISTGALNDLISDAVRMQEPPSYQGRRMRVYFSQQVAVRPPLFVLHVNDEGLLHFSYERYLENTIRRAYDFSGTPIKIVVREKKDEE